MTADNTAGSGPGQTRSGEFKGAFPATATGAENALERILATVEETNIPCGDLDEIRLALREALNNAVRHGSGLDPAKEIQVACRCDAKNGFWVMVRDEGKGFDPDRVPDPTEPENLERPGGRGVFMMRRLMDEVEFRDGGREIHMRRRPRP